MLKYNKSFNYQWQNICQRAKSCEEVADAFVVTVDEIVLELKMRKTKNGINLLFAHFWNTSKDLDLVLDKMFIFGGREFSIESLCTKASYLRSKGWYLKKFKTAPNEDQIFLTY